jgi:hypothetical protein
LRENGFESCLNEAASVFAQSSSHIKSFKKIPLGNPFPYYSITKDTFSELFDPEASEIIISSIRKEILRRVNLQTDDDIEQILNRIQKKELFKYLKNLTGHEHILFLWSNQQSRDKIMNQFFIQPSAPQGLMSAKKMKLENVENITYSEVFENKEAAIQKEFQMIDQIHKKNLQLIWPTRLAGTDCTQWFKQGLTKEFLLLEKKADKYFEKNKISCICGYDINEIPNDRILKKLLNYHDYVVLDDPYFLFKRAI